MRLLTIVVPGLVALTAAYGASFSDIIVYGDSLSDNGNAYALSSSLGVPEPPSPPYYQGRFSNGPVAVEDLAAQFGVPLMDFAYGGATTGLGDSVDGGSVVKTVFAPGMSVQFALSQSTVAPLAPTSLFIVWGGPDDLSAPDPLDTTPQAIANRAAADIINIVSGLQALGAKEILVPGVTDLADVPAYASNAAAAALFAATFDNDLLSGLPKGATYVDTFNLLQQVVANPAQYGFTNVTSPCLVGVIPCANPNQYLFWDSQHPTAAAHELLAADLAAVVIPEPSTALLGVGALAAFACARKYRKRRG